MIACRSPVEERPPSILTPRGIGYGPRSDSSAYSEETRVLRCFLPTTVIGIPIGAPSQRPEPKSAWTLPLCADRADDFVRVGGHRKRVHRLVPRARLREDRAARRGGHLEGARRRASEQERAEAQQQDRTSHRSVIDMSKRSTKGSSPPPKEWTLLERDPPARHRHARVHAGPGHAVRPNVRRVAGRSGVKRPALMVAAAVELRELGSAGEERNDRCVDARLFLDLSHETVLERLVVIDAPSRDLRQACVLEHEELASACDVPDGPFADERRDEVAAQAPNLGVRTDGNPAAMDGTVLADVLPGLGQQPRGLELDVVADRGLPDADDADELCLDSGLFHDLPDRRLLDCLALFDSSPWNDRAVLGRAGEVEDEQLVESGLRVLARDVRGDWRPGSQLACARILALCSRFFAWYQSSFSRESTSPSVGWDGVSPSAAWTPKRFQSTADSALIFISPNPGSPEMRF